MEFADYLELLSSDELAHLSASASAEFAAKDTGLAVVMPTDGLVTRARRP